MCHCESDSAQVVHSTRIYLRCPCWEVIISCCETRLAIANSPSGYSIYKEILKSHNTASQWLIIPVHCDSAVADPPGFTLRLEENRCEYIVITRTANNFLSCRIYSWSLSCSCQHATASVTVWNDEVLTGLCDCGQKTIQLIKVTDSNTCNGNLLFTTWLSKDTKGHQGTAIISMLEGRLNSICNVSKSRL